MTQLNPLHPQSSLPPLPVNRLAGTAVKPVRCQVAMQAESSSAMNAGHKGAFTAMGMSADRPRLMVEIFTKKSGVGTAVLVAFADSGATKYFLTKQAANRIRLCIRQVEIELAGIHGPSSTLGKAYVCLQVADFDMKEKVRMILVDDLPEGQEMLLGCCDLKLFGLVHHQFPQALGGGTGQAASAPSQLQAGGQWHGGR